MTNRIIDIACNIDNAYLTHCKVMLTSLFENNKQENFCIHLLGFNLTIDAENDIKSFVEDIYKQQIRLYNIKENDLLIIKKCGSEHISLAANIRMSLGTILPKSLDKILYLDCDMVILDSIREIIDTCIDDVAVGVVEDMYCGKEEIYSRLHYDKTFSYFNSGLLWINLKYWRENDVENRLLDFYQKYSDGLIFIDQDLLNATLYKEKIYLPLRYNLQTGFYRKKIHYRQSLKEQVNMALSHPAVIHFTSKKKPWEVKCMHPYRYLYAIYYKMTFGQEFKINKTLPQRLNIAMYKLSLLLGLANGYIKTKHI